MRWNFLGRREPAVRANRSMADTGCPAVSLARPRVPPRERRPTAVGLATVQQVVSAILMVRGARAGALTVEGERPHDGLVDERGTGATE